MQFGDDERAAAIQIGAVLLFAMLIISMALYQATAVPDQNKGVEFNHNQKVQGQMQDLRNAVVSVPGGGNGGSVTVDLGTTYPSRTLFVNPGPPSGTLRTVGTNDEDVNVTIENATATGETGDFWNGTERDFETGALVYQPRYHEYRNPPTTVYEHSLLYNQFRDDNLTVSDQTLVNDRQITLVTLDGNLSENGMGSASVTARPVSASSNTVAVEADSGPINITVPTRLDNDTWEDALGDQYVSNGGHVAGQYYEPVSNEPYGLLTIELEQGETYDLQMAKVGVGSGASAESSNQYLTNVGSTSKSVPSGGTEEITVEVRDEYSNPVSGEEVTLDANEGEFENDSNPSATVTRTSNSDGEVTVTYAAPDDGTESDNVRATIHGGGSNEKEVEFSIDVQTGGDSSGSGAYTLQWDTDEIDATTAMSCYSFNETCVIDLQDSTSATMTANTTEPTSQVFVDFASNDTAVASFTPSYDETGSAGEVSTTVDLTEGRARVSASAAEDGDSLIVKVIDSAGEPTADAGGPYDVDEGNTTSIDGSNSNDDNGIVYYDWEITNDPTGNASITDADNTTPEATFEAPDNVDTSQDVTVQLVVTDTDGNTDTDSGTVTVLDTDRSDTTPPTISDATITDQTDNDGNVTTGDTVLVEVTASDSGSGVDSVTADTTDFGGPSSLTLTDGDGDGTYNETFTVESSSSATEGDQSVNVTVFDGAGNSNMATTNTLTVDTTAPSISGFSTTNPSGMTVSVTFDSDEMLEEIRVPIDDSSGTTVTTLTASEFTESASGGTYTYNGTYTVATEDNYTATLTRAEDVADNDGASGETDYVIVDSTSPNFTALNATAINDGTGSGGGGSNDAEKVRFGYETTDNIEVDRVRMVVYDNNGAEVANETRTVTNDTYTVTLSSRVSVNGNSDVSVEVTAFDTSGNGRQCTGAIQDVGSANMIEKQNGDFTCSNV